MYESCLIVDQYDPASLTKEPLKEKKVEDYRLDVYLATVYGPQGDQAVPYNKETEHVTLQSAQRTTRWEKSEYDANYQTQWAGDGFVCDKADEEKAVWELANEEQRQQPTGNVRRPVAGRSGAVRFVLDTRALPRADYQIRERKQTRIMITYSLSLIHI